MEDQFSSDEITTKPSPKFSWKHMLIILLTAIIAGGGVWAYYQFVILPDLEKKAEVIAPADPTADWQTYTNDKYNYTFKYPKDWFAYDKGAYSLLTKTYEGVKDFVYVGKEELKQVNANTEGPCYNGFEITATNQVSLGEVKAHTSGESPNDCGAATKTEVDLSKITKISTETTAIKAVLSKPACICEKYYTTYVFNHNNKGWSMSFVNEDSSGKHDSTYDNILKTFKFTEATAATDETADWETYTNTKYNYSFKYPDSVKLNSFVGEGNDAEITADAENVIVRATNNSEGWDFEVVKGAIATLTADAVKNNWPLRKETPTETKIDGVDGFKISLDKVDYYFVQKEGQSIIEIGVNTENSTATKMLKTFKFTK